MNADLVVTLVAALVGSAGLAALFNGAGSLSKGARLRHRIEKDSALAEKFPEDSEARVALDLLRADAAHQLSAYALYPLPPKTKALPFVFGGAGVIFSLILLLRVYGPFATVPPEDGERLGIWAPIVVGLAYVVAGFFLRAKLLGRWRRRAGGLLHQEIVTILTDGPVASGAVTSRWAWKDRDYGRREEERGVEQ